MLYRLLEYVKPFLLPALLALAVWQWVRRRPPVSLVLLGILAATIGAHWLLLKYSASPCRWIGRRSGSCPCACWPSGPPRPDRRALTVMLYVMSFYFLFCLRLNYFKEWNWDADVNKIYPVLAWYNHTYGVRDIASNWMYGSALNFYRVQSGRESFGEIESPLQLPTDRSLYVLCYRSTRNSSSGSTCAWSTMPRIRTRWWRSGRRRKRNGAGNQGRDFDKLGLT